MMDWIREIKLLCFEINLRNVDSGNPMYVIIKHDFTHYVSTSQAILIPNSAWNMSDFFRSETECIPIDVFHSFRGANTIGLRGTVCYCVPFEIGETGRHRILRR